MRVLKYLALAGMLAMVCPVASLASANNAREQKKNVTVVDKIELAGKTLNPGQYQVEWMGTGPVVHVQFMQHGQTLLTAPARVAQLHQKAPYSAVVESTKKNGAKTISEIEWNNQREALMFGANAHRATAHHTHKRAS